MEKDAEHHPFVILSGAYCSADIVAEYGRLPPAFLPAGGRRLFEQQIEIARGVGGVPVLTVPADYTIDPWDIAVLKREQVRIIRTPTSLTLCEAVQFVLEVLESKGPISLLHGDTLVQGSHLLVPDQIAVCSTQDYYSWSDVAVDDFGEIQIRTGYGDGRSHRQIACGYFTFSDAAALRQAFLNQSDFGDALAAYSLVHLLKPLKVSAWYDFGHLVMIYKSKRDMLVSRAFNTMTSDGTSVSKSSEKNQKISAEINWYKTIPEQLRAYTPQFLGEEEVDGRVICKLEYLYQPTLSELFVFGDLPPYIWRSILDSCLGFLTLCHQNVPAPDSSFASPEYANDFYEKVIVEKSRQRIQTFCEQRNWKDNCVVTINGVAQPGLFDVVDRLISLVSRTQPADMCLWHGDFFFGNLFYDFRAARIRVVDPRGCVSEDEFSVYGDWRYDVAKLAHSIVGRYDMLLSGRMEFEKLDALNFNFEKPQTNLLNIIEEDFLKLNLGDRLINSTEIGALTALMFLSMLPLHAEDPVRQNIMLCNGLELAAKVLEN
ncbi:MAG: phosphotransferase [Alphaproteobacteria bacterium]|nr:phosphotransferase [Alphaproteobacteria bacterium]